ncbi:hypothetical protein [Halostreptopolyspora alba]|uniref:DUF4352 domain-containing protein n=1 Tax=Halostreptopolyspora alba TaxID=2487137 RepID=A0A3N0EDC5_9ACTN|nr:hypothetical protein EFW17_07845 [Nocardiopsaceae bacterium YIM 96095]
MNPSHRSLPRLLRSAALCLLLLVLIGVVRAHQIEFDQRLAPIAYSGEAGEVVDASRFTIEVEGVEFGRDIAGGDFDHLTGAEADPDYVWMVVTVTVEATMEAMTIHEPVRLESGGDVYAGMVSSPLPAGAATNADELRAGIPVTGAVAFELPPDSIEDPALRVTAVTAGLGSDERLSSEAVVDLGLDEDELRGRVDDAAEVVEVAAGADERRAPAAPAGVTEEGATVD